ncbi:MAG: DUF3604 domain-containing protein [Lysobacterales bacterium]
MTSLIFCLESIREGRGHVARHITCLVTDPEFDAGRRAYYYVGAPEIPTPS